MVSSNSSSEVPTCTMLVTFLLSITGIVTRRSLGPPFCTVSYTTSPAKARSRVPKLADKFSASMSLLFAPTLPELSMICISLPLGFLPSTFSRYRSKLPKRIGSCDSVIEEEMISPIDLILASMLLWRLFWR